ncbi:MAG: phosphate acyltransferase PlsX [Candidatus Dadabacteria bacterium]|nr:MAG: phosphate acyltransferase PlsX [Candidatus Dadabacteria bacterium]
MPVDNLPAKSPSKPVAVDAMGGDQGVKVVVEGAIRAARDLGISSVLVGDEKVIKACLRKFGADNSERISIHHASEVIEMDESPATAVRRKPDSSICRAFQLLSKGEVSSVVSAGNTGAVMVGGLKYVGAVPGIARPAIASLIPKMGEDLPTVLLDAGANIDCHAFQLVQFAIMGSLYSNSILGIAEPRVALLSNGSELTKGTDIIRSAANTLSMVQNINFVGYVEGNDISRNKADVVVCDGFAGNVLLKAIEGAVELVFDTIQRYVEKSNRGKLGFWLAKPAVHKVFNKKLDPSAYGGAPLLGLNGVAIICHGGSDARSIMNGIRVADKFVGDGLLLRISSAIADFEVQVPGGYEDGTWGRMGMKFVKQKAAKDKGAKKPSTLE